MSYCRFSSDEFDSDIYCYESVGDYFAIHVAGNRVVDDGTKPKVTAKLVSEEIEEYARQDMALMEWMKTAQRVDIDLPYAGQSFSEPDAESAAQRLIELKDLGYHVPQYAIDALLEEAQDNAKISEVTAGAETG